MTSDQAFDQYRLTQLTEQLLSGTSISGDIVFFADEDEGRVGGATWRFEEDDQAFLKENDFRFMLMELLDVLIQHRVRQGSSDTLNGVIHLEKSSPNIQWLTAPEAQAMRLC